jgi:membrane-bound lytic murein transglycosylase A
MGRPAAALLLGVLAITLGHDNGPRRFGITPVGFDRLSGWAEDHVSAAVPVFLKSCARFLTQADAAPLDPVAASVDFGRVGDWRGVCEAAEALPPWDDSAARQFFETNFSPFAVADYGTPEGLFTGYYEIDLNGSRQPHGRFQTPLYRKPPDLGVQPPTRAEIEDGALAGRGLELFWVDDPIDAFFLEIQGSGRIRLSGGGTVRIGYDGQNGRPYVPVGRLLIERGAIPRDKLTMPAIRSWMKQNPEAGAALRRENPSFVFFREIKGDGPIGAEGVVLSAERSMAVDRTFVALGIPVWLEANERFAAVDGVRRLMIAQDTGGAIKGPVRGDVFWGTGAAAGVRAGIMNASGRYHLLVPRAVARRIAPGDLARSD